MSILEYWHVVRKRLWLVLLLVLVGLLASGYLSLQAPQQYRSTTTLFLNPAAANPLLPYQSTKTVQSVANTYIEFMHTRSFAGFVTEQSGLALTPDDILKALSTQYVVDTQFFRITATYTDPGTAQTLANIAAQVLIAQNSARQQAEQAQIQLQRGTNPERQRLIELRDSLQSQITTYNERINQLQTQLQDFQLRPPSTRTDQRISQLQQELLGLQAARTQTLTSLAQAQSSLAASDTSSTVPVDTAVVVDTALLPSEPLSRNILQRMLLGLVGGLVVGVGMALALEYIDYTIHTPEALDSAYGQSSLGVIGKADDKDILIHGPGEPTYQLTATASRTPVAESIRALRTNIQIASLPGSLNTLMITSAGPSEGKSFVACNLAVSIAQQGSLVVLVDLDLRKPYIHHAFGLKREPGFTNLVVSKQMYATDMRPQLQKVLSEARNGASLRQRYLGGAGSIKTILASARLQELLDEVETSDPETQAAASDLRRTLDQRVDLHEFLQPTHIENLWVLTCGLIPPNPAELLSSPQAAQVMKYLQEFADIVIYDTPPAVTVTDALIVAQRVEAVIHVVAAGKTRINTLQHCKALLQQAGVGLIGSVLNMVRVSDMGYYGYYYQDYYQEGAEKRSIFARLLPGRNRSRQSPPRTSRPTITRPAAPATPAEPLSLNGHPTKHKID